MEIPRQKAKGETTVQCLEGRVNLSAMGRIQVLSTGMLIDLPADEPHTFKGIEDASLLLTMVAKH